MLVAQQGLTEVYFGDPMVVVIQATKPITLQTDTVKVQLVPGRLCVETTVGCASPALEAVR